MNGRAAGKTPANNKDRYYMTKLNPIVQIGSMLIGILLYRVFFVSSANK